MRVAIIGCGYVGVALGRLLAGSGHTVFGVRRSNAGDAELTAAGIIPLHADITQPASLSQLPKPLDAVVNLVSSSKGGASEYRQVYLQGTENLLTYFTSASLHRYIHVSSTSVYAQTDGSWVDEASPATASGDTGQLLLEAEQQLQRAHAASGFPSIVVRASGIYGPGRGHLFQQFVRGEARAMGDSSRWINMIHRDDLAAALATLMNRGTPGALYLANDNQPVQEREFFDWLCEIFQRPYPSPADPSAVGRRKRGFSSKRVSNARLRAAGWEPLYPTYREGYAPMVQEQLQPQHASVS